MDPKLHNLPTYEILSLLNLERKKFLRAIDYGSPGSDLEDIRDAIRELESIISSRQDVIRGQQAAASFNKKM